jgi:hypothetical protein
MVGQSEVEGNSDHVSHSMAVLYVDTLVYGSLYGFEYRYIKLKENLNCYEKSKQLRGLTYMYIKLYSEDCHLAS